MSKHLTADEAQRLRASEARATASRFAAAQSGRNDSCVAAPGLGDARMERDSCGVGFIADLKGGKSHDIIANGLQILGNLTHRGAVGADPLVGDGAGMLAQIPHDLFRAECDALGFALPQPGDYGIGVLFMPQDAGRRAHYEAIVERVVAEEGQQLLGWRTVPADTSSRPRDP